MFFFSLKGNFTLCNWQPLTFYGKNELAKSCANPRITSIIANWLAFNWENVAIVSRITSADKTRFIYYIKLHSFKNKSVLSAKLRWQSYSVHMQPSACVTLSSRCIRKMFVWLRWVKVLFFFSSTHRWWCATNETTVCVRSNALFECRAKVYITVLHSHFYLIFVPWSIKLG